MRCVHSARAFARGETFEKEIARMAKKKKAKKKKKK